MNRMDNHEIANNIKDYLVYLKEIGINELPIEIDRNFDSRDRCPAEIKTVSANNDAKPKTLEDVRRIIGDCKRCGLNKKRKNIVFGSGNEKAEIVFVGEAPGGDEDIQGKPFVGKAGQLLTKIIEAMGLKREDVYIANIIKCRPPNNRNPLEDEISACEPFLKEQLRIINPRIICALGTFAAQTLLKTKEKITSLRGKFYTYEGIKLMPTFHPAYLLRNPNDKKYTWEDVQKIMAEYKRLSG